MQWQLLFFSMLPVVVFAAVESLYSNRDAVVAAIVVAAIEFAYNSFALGFVEPFSAVSLLSFGALGALGLARDRMLLVKLQPVVMALVWAGAFWIHDATAPSETRLFEHVLYEYVGIGELIPPYQAGYFAGYAHTMSRSLPFLLVLHAGWTAWAAFRLSTSAWALVRVLGFYGLAVALFCAERFLQASY